MAQISTKFLANDAVNESKFRLSNDSALRGRNAANSADVDLFKLDASDILQFLAHPRISSSASNADDVLTKKDQDAALEGIKPKEAVRVATTANITLSGEQTIDGVLTSTDRILVKNQTTVTENGIYVTAAGAWARAADASTAAELSGAYTFVQEGTTQTGYGYVQYGTLATLGADDVTFTVRSNFDLTGGDGIAITGNSFAVDHDGEGLTFATAQLSLELDGSTLSKSGTGLKVGTITEAELGSDIDAESFQLSAGYVAAAGTPAIADTIEVAIEKIVGNANALNAESLALTAGYAAAAGTVAIADTVEEAIEKLDGNFAARTPDDIDLTAGYLAAAGTVAIGDSVEVAVEKLDGNISALTPESFDLTAGYAAAAGTVAIGDSVEEAIEKIVGNVAALDAEDLAIATGYNAATATGNVAVADTIQEAIEKVEKKVDDVAAASTLAAQENFTLIAGDITNQYVDLAQTAITGSVHMIPSGGPAQVEGIDFTLSDGGGFTRVTFAGDLATGGDAALVATDVLYIKYLY